MPFLIVLNGRMKGQAIEVGPDPIEVGQSGDAGLKLGDPWVSWMHARITRSGGTYWIEDLGSTNGTYVNCGRIRQREALADEDVIFLGRTHLIFLESRPSSGVVLPPPAPPAYAHMAPSKPDDTSKIPGMALPNVSPEAAMVEIEEEDAGSMPAAFLAGPTPTLILDESAFPDTIEPLDLGAETGGVLDAGGAGEAELAAAGEPPPLVPPPPAGRGVPEESLAIDVADLLDSQGGIPARPTVVGGGRGTRRREGHQPSISAPAPRAIADLSTPPLGAPPPDAPEVAAARLKAEVKRLATENERLRAELQALKERYLDLEE